MAEETDFGVYTFLYKNINDSIIDTVYFQILRISAIIQAPVTVAMTLYVILYGWMILRGDVEEPMTAFLKRCLKLAIIWYVIINPVFFWKIFAKVMLHTLPNDIITAITGKLAGNPVDAYASHGFQAAGNMWRDAEWYEIGTILLAGIVVISTALSSVAAFFIFAMSDMSVAMLLILGPIFICLLLYETTNRWFSGWLSALVTFVLLKILLISLLSLVHKILENMMKLSTGWETVVLGLNVLIVYFVGFFIFLKLYDIAASIGGGPVMSGMGATANAGIKAYKRFQERNKPNSAGNSSSSETKKPSGKTSGSPPNSGKDSPSDSPQGSGKGDKIYSNNLAYSAGGTMAKWDAGSITNMAVTLGSIQDVRTAAKSMERPASQQQQQARTQRQAQQHQEQAKITSGAASAPSPSAVTAAPSSAGGSSGASSGSSGASGSLDHLERQRKEYE